MTKRFLLLCALLCAACLAMPGCKTTKANEQPTPAVSETSGDVSDKETTRTPSELEQPDWQSSPPGMPEPEE